MNSKIIDQHIPCEACGSSDARCNYDDGHGYCFSCETYFPPDKVESNEVFSYQYAPWRAVTAETMRYYDVKTKCRDDGTPVSLGFLYPNNSIKVRQLDKKAFHSIGEISKGGLFGRNKFSAGSHKYVTITEGELDALSLWQVLRTPVVSVRSGSSAEHDAAMDRSWLNSFERIYLAFDNDDAGRDAANRVARLFDYNKLYSVKFDRHKDANDYLRAGDADELRQVWWNAKRYLPEWIISSNSEFEKILFTEPAKGIPYPFPTLNHMTYGIRTGESVLLTAMEGVGKTEIMHSILHQTLRSTNDNIGAIFLEEPKQRLLQSLAGLEIQRPVHLPDCGVQPGEVYRALTGLIRRDDRLHVYSHFGSADPDVLLDTIRFLASARTCRYIFFDHITMGISGLGGEDERRALDYISTRLEMMVKELDFGLIFVSHVNDLGQTRGSRNISKVADIRIDATRDLISGDSTVRNTTHLVVSKNRFSGKTGPAGSLIFNPETYTLLESGCSPSLTGFGDDDAWENTSRSPLGNETDTTSSIQIRGHEYGSQDTDKNPSNL